MSWVAWRLNDSSTLEKGARRRWRRITVGISRGRRRSSRSLAIDYERHLEDAGKRRGIKVPIRAIMKPVG